MPKYFVYSPHFVRLNYHDLRNGSYSKNDLQSPFATQINYVAL